MVDVSFIIPVYNVSAYLPKFISSFSYANLECEIIFVDDGSTDDSCEIIQKFSKEDRRVILLKKTNGGVSSARNYGIANANGTFIACLDPDDVVMPSFFDYLRFIIGTIPDVDTIVYGYKKFLDGTEPNISTDIFNCNNIKKIKKTKLSAFHNYPWLRVVRRTFYTNNPFPEGIIYEDSVTIPLLNSKAMNIRLVTVPLYCYRVRNNSLTNIDPVRNMDLLTALDILTWKVQQTGTGHEQLYACVAHLARSALITLYKVSRDRELNQKFEVNFNAVVSKFRDYSAFKVLSSGANIFDKLCYLTLRLNKVGFNLFSLLYSHFKK